jgi:hypothetical protein
MAAWLEEKAIRPMWVAVGALLGIGLIGVGLVPGGTAVRGNLGAAGANTSSGAIPISDCATCASGGSTTTPAHTSAYNLFPSLNPTGYSGNTITVGYNSVGSTNSGGSSSSSGGSSSGGSSSGGSSGGGSGTGNGGGSGGGGGGGGGTTPTTTPSSSTSPTTVLDVAGIASVTKSGSTVNVNVLPTSSGGSTASVSVGCSTIVGVTVGTTSIGCSSTSTTVAPSSTTTTTTPLTSVVSTVTQTVTSTLNSLTGGL